MASPWDREDGMNSTRGKQPLRTVTVPAGYEIQDFGKGRGGGYHIDGEKVAGVTTALGIIDGGKSGGMAWSAARIWLAGMHELLNEDGEPAIGFDATPDEFEAELKEAQAPSHPQVGRQGRPRHDHPLSPRTSLRRHRPHVGFLPRRGTRLRQGDLRVVR
jgi:hypothetical protein